MVGIKTESGEKKGVSVHCIVHSDVHDGHIKLQTTHNVQSETGVQQWMALGT